MHVAFASHSADLLGAERSLIPLVAEAVRRSHRVTATTPRPGPLVRQLNAAGATVTVLSTRSWMGKRFNLVVGGVRLAQAMMSVRAYERYFRRIQPDVVVTNSAVLPAPALAARRLGLPNLWLIQESVLTNPTLRAAVPRRALVRTIERTATELVAVSRYVADQVVAAAPAAAPRLHVIAPSLLPRASFRPPPSRETALRSLLILGKFSAEKGQDDALAALAMCSAQGLNIRLTFAGLGSGDGLAQVRRLAQRYEVAHLVDLVEWTDEPEALYQAADAVLMLSRNEAYGRATVESLLCGTPVIGYDAGCTTELLENGGGILIRPNPVELATVLRQLAADPQRLGQLRSEACERGRQLAVAPDSAA